MRIRWHSVFVVLLALSSLCSAAKERISILDFTRFDAAAKKLVTESEVKDLTQQVRDQAAALVDTSRFEIMTLESIMVMLPPGKSLTECEGQCEVETARNLGSRWHVVGDVKKVGKKLVLSVRLYDVASGTQLGGVRVKQSTVDALSDSTAVAARELLSKIPGVGRGAVPAPQSAPAPVVLPAAPAPTAAPAKLAKPGMVSIPAGCFEMGSPSGVGSDDEHPQHRVCLSAFSMDATDVTQSAYQSVVGSNPSNFKNCGGNCPVESVNWQEANDYCHRVGKRLPTEAEWEYAARAGTTTKWYWGDDESRTGDYAWYSGNSGSTTHPVGQKQPNAWGLYDMAGNVWQWTSDWKGDYSSGDQQNPTGPSSGSSRVNRGGSWFFVPGNLRSASRRARGPGARDDNLGFRCAGP